MIRRQRGGAAMDMPDSGTEELEPMKARYPTRDKAAGGAAHLPPCNVYEQGCLRIDFDAYEVFLEGRRIHLYLREFEILRFFVQFPNRVFTRARILESVWGSKNRGIDPRTIDVHVRRLRTRIERDHAHPELIVTVRGVGYKFDARAWAARSATALQP